jgi:hypothetical protein
MHSDELGIDYILLLMGLQHSSLGLDVLNDTTENYIGVVIGWNKY